MFKRILVYLLLIGTLSPMLNIVVTLADFQVHRRYYAEVLCINKNRPELFCQGKCVLMQQLKNEFQQQEQEHSQTLKNILEHEIIFFFQPFKVTWFDTHLLHWKALKKPQQPIYFKNFIPQNFLKAIFHPPDAEIVIA